MINTLVMNTIGPFIVWKTQKLPANIVFEVIDGEVFIREASEEYIRLAESLEALDFSCIGSSVLSDTDSDTFFRLYWNPELRIAATCVSGINVLGETVYIEYSQKYSDGSMLDVSNNPVTEAFPKLNIKTSYRYPLVFDARELLEIFIKLRDGYKSSSVPIDFDIDGGFKEVESFMRRESDELIDKGIVKPEIDSEGKRALTFYGAIYLTYRAVSPGKNIFGYFAENEAKRALRRV